MMVPGSGLDQRSRVPTAFPAGAFPAHSRGVDRYHLGDFEYFLLGDERESPGEPLPPLMERPHKEPRERPCGDCQALSGARKFLGAGHGPRDAVDEARAESRGEALQPLTQRSSNLLRSPPIGFARVRVGRVERLALLRGRIAPYTGEEGDRTSRTCEAFDGVAETLLSSFPGASTVRGPPC